MSTPVPDRDGYLARWSALHGGYDPRRGWWLVRGYLALVHGLARPLAARGVGPSAVTGAGVVGAALVMVPAAMGDRWPLCGIAVVVLSGLADSLDGAVAILTGRASAWGYVLDSVADRVGDACYLGALWLLGAPGGLVVAAGLALGLLEYTRARAGAAGFAEIGVVTVGERPTRIIATGFGLLGAGLVPGLAGVAGTVATAAVLAVCVVGLAQLVRTVRPALRGRGLPPPPGSAPAPASAARPASAPPRESAPRSGPGEAPGPGAGPPATPDPPARRRSSRRG